MSFDSLDNDYRGSSVNSSYLRLAFSVLQAPDVGEEVLTPDQSQSQQPGLQHSFVKEHFQAQYK